MPQYRLYLLDGAGCVTGAEWLDAPGDDLAIEAAAVHDTVQCEVWQGRRLVTRLGPDAAIPLGSDVTGPADRRDPSLVRAVRKVSEAPLAARLHRAF